MTTTAALSTSHSVPTAAPPLESSERLIDLWKQAVIQYENELSTKDKEIFQKTKTPEDAFNPAWKNIAAKQSGHLKGAQETVTQVLGVIQVVNAALGLASVVRPSLTQS